MRSPDARGLQCAARQCGPSFIDGDPSIFLKFLTHLTLRLATLVRRTPILPHEQLEMAAMFDADLSLVNAERGGLEQERGVVD